MKILLFSLVTILSMKTFACDEYRDDPYFKEFKEVAPSEVTKLGRGLKNKNNQDMIYVACTEKNGEECSKKTFVLESAVCGKSYEINPRLHLNETNADFVRSEIRKEVNSLSVNFEDYYIWTELAVLATIEESFVFLLAVPFGAAIDLIKAPILLAQDSVDLIKLPFNSHKMNSTLKESDNGAKKSKKINDHDFNSVVWKISSYRHW